MKHFGKMVGVRTRECSKCGGDLGDRYGKQRYCKACHAANMRANRPKHSELLPLARKKANCRAYSKEMLRRGKIKKQDCSKCECQDSQMHHEDYNKPMEIIWLCRPCHLNLHKTHDKI